LRKYHFPQRKSDIPQHVFTNTVINWLDQCH
jgi:hypothetical protein